MGSGGDKRFISEAIVAQAGSFDASVASRGEPSLPRAFDWRGERLDVERITRTWRSHKVDRGDTYLKRHWFEFEARDGRVAVVYFDRGARRGAERWWLYTLEARTGDASDATPSS